MTSLQEGSRPPQIRQTETASSHDAWDQQSQTNNHSRPINKSPPNRGDSSNSLRIGPLGRPSSPEKQGPTPTIWRTNIEEPEPRFYDTKMSPYFTSGDFSQAYESNPSPQLQEMSQNVYASGEHNSDLGVIKADDSHMNASNSHEARSNESRSSPVNESHLDPSPGIISLRSTELQDCESEADAFSPSPELQWAAAASSEDRRKLRNDPPQPSHLYHSLDDQGTPDLQYGHEIKRDPQNVQVLQFSDRIERPTPLRNQDIAASSSTAGSFKRVFETALQESDGQSSERLGSRSDSLSTPNTSAGTSIRTYGGEEDDNDNEHGNEEDDEDDEHGHTLLESLPTPRMNSPRMGFTTESYAAPFRHNSMPMLAPPNGMISRKSINSPSLFRASHSPQQSQSSSSENSGVSPSPKLPQMRPKSSIGNRTANRQSYYDFSGSTNNFNLNLSDAVAAVQNSSGTSSGAANALLPRMKTIEMYRKNARKTNDPELEFQLAQYMMQTALIAASERLHDDGSRRNTGLSSLSNGVSPETTVSNQLPNTENDKSSKTKDGNKPSAADKSLDKIIGTLFKEAISSLKRLSERGFADAQYLLGDVYSSEALTNKPDMERSFKYFMMAAKHGHAEAAYRAALCLQEGWGTSRDAARAVQFYTKAAVKNQPGALYQLGMAYFYGGMGISDTSANRLAGVKWLSRAVNVSDQTYNRAPHELAKIYEVGFKDLVIPDNNYAAKLYAHAADLGFVPSAARLARAYEFGEIGCPQDPNLSIHYYTIAALGNDPSAQLAMCAWYMVGAGPSFPVNHDEAYEWALRAALNGLPKAQYTLGFFYENGTGTRRNLIEAGKWYRRAAANGYEKATVKLKNLGINDNDKRKNKCLIM